jgi:hypothetical protein
MRPLRILTLAVVAALAFGVLVWAVVAWLEPERRQRGAFDCCRFDESIFEEP